MTAIWCPGGCDTRILADEILCSTCRLTVEKYEAENPQIAKAFSKYVLKGLGGLEALLAQHPPAKKGKP